MSAVIPPQVSEAANGALLFMLVVAMFFFAMYILRAWEGRLPVMGWHGFYTYENKAAIALLTSSIGMSMKVGAEWWSAHVVNHGGASDADALIPIYAVGTCVSLWGLICLMRALSRYDWRRSTWLWLAAGSIAFGVLFSL